MLKPYNELVQVDVLPRCDYREAKDERGQKVKVPYLNWAVCKSMLHENGAETVYYTPLKTPEGSYLFGSREVANKDGRKNGCWIVSVEVHIDDLTFTMDMPLLNGSLVVYEDTLNQARISNAHARAFVKGVAIHTGLGFKLWMNEKDTDPAPDDLSGHSILAIKQRLELLLTEKQKQGWSMGEIQRQTGLSEKGIEKTMKMMDEIYLFEERLKKL